MAWQDNARIPLRVLIDDIDSETYSDATLDKLLITAAGQIIYEVNLNINYNIDYLTATVSPDPSDDDHFINFTVLKAACLKAGWDFVAKVNIDGTRAKLGPLSIDISAGQTALNMLLTKGPCKTYQEMTRQYNFGKTSILKGILTPFSHEDLNLY